MATTLKFYLCDTVLGWIGLVLSPKGLRAVTAPRPEREQALREAADLGASEPASEAEAGDLPRRLRAWARGEAADPSTLRQSSGQAGSGQGMAPQIDWDGISGFRRAVMEETLRIPAGQTRSYGWLAERVGSPRAARAVGRVMATNPMPFVVPCHRVVASDGSLGGYGAGLALKEALLRLEGARK